MTFTRLARAFVALAALVAHAHVAHAQVETTTTTSTITRAGGGGTGGGAGGGTGGGAGGGTGGGAGGGTGADTGAGSSNQPTTTPATTTALVTTAPSSSTSGQGRGTGWFDILSQLDDNEVELRSLRGGGMWDAFCNGAPVIVSKSLSVPVNAACVDNWTNLSCTCVSELKIPSTVWRFRVTKRARELPLVAPIPATTSNASALGDVAAVTISTVGAFTVPPELTALQLIGVSATPLELQWDFKLHWGQLNASVLVTSRDPTTSALQSIEVANLSLASVNITSDFVPANLVNLTLRNCAIKELSPTFLTKHYATLKRLDLSGNAFTGIPASVFGLQKAVTVNLRGNPITDFTITKSQFAQTKTLAALQLDGADSPTAVACPGGELKAASGVTFCVLPDGSSSSSTLYVAVGIPVCVVVFAAAAIVYRKRASLWGTKKPQHSSSLSLLESTGSQDYSVVIIDDALLKDPLLLMNRIPYTEVVVKQCVNRGGFGVVYSGVYKHRPVAIKRIRTEFNTDILRVEAFLREICLVASLSHPRIVEFIGVAWDTLQNLSAVTELMDQGDLRDVLQSHKKNNKPLTWDAHKMRIALHIAEALAYLHSLVPTVIHRDLKSKNVLLNAELDAKLSDFGISREWTVDDTHMTVGIGTSFWIAPEVLLGKKYDERADVFSFGVVLNELDTDDYPYWNAVNGAVDLNENAILRLVAVGQVRPTFTPNCPRAILELADVCLQGNPQHRPTSAQIVNVLRHLLAHGGDSSYLSSSQMSITGSISTDSFY